MVGRLKDETSSCTPEHKAREAATRSSRQRSHTAAPQHELVSTCQQLLALRCVRETQKMHQCVCVEKLYICVCACVWAVSLQACCAPVTDSADSLLCDGTQRSTQWRSSGVEGQAIVWCVQDRTGQSSVAHDSASPLESSCCLVIYFSDVWGLGLQEKCF